MNRCILHDYLDSDALRYRNEDKKFSNKESDGKEKKDNLVPF